MGYDFSMAYKKSFDTSSAYGQLILLVFLPICVLAMVGGILVFYETMRAGKSEQEALAEAVLIRYTPMVIELMPILIEQAQQQALDNEKTAQQIIDGTMFSGEKGAITTSDTSATALSQTTRLTNNGSAQDTKASLAAIRDSLSRLQSEQHVQRIAVVSNDNRVISTMGYGVNEAWPSIDSSQGFLSKQSTAIGTAYGRMLGEFEGQKLWLMIDMDNEPLYIARYRIAMALAITGLITILILLLTLNIYAKRWITPIYELRLLLQRTHINNLYKPIPVESNGELNLLQQDLAKTLRRLHGSFRDLTDHAAQSEDDLRIAFDEMEMQNISIRNARDAAISNSRAKSAFLANISHELRTPLNSIDGFINLLARHGELNAEQDLYVQTIRKSSAHLLALVNDVLDFSKIEAGKLVLDRHEFNLYDTVYDVVDMLSPVSSEKGLRVAVLFYNDVPMRIIGDALRLKQVLTNLVGNAIKFTDSGEVIVRVSLDDHKDNYLLISVQDSGKGISAADQKLLFKSFSQGDPSTTRQYGGTGLGLVICRQITRLMGGDIGFYDNAQQNIAKQGATFWFRMPAHVDVLEVETGQAIALPVLSALGNVNNANSANDDLNVLVWINHIATRQVMKASLQNLPIKLTQANSLPGVLESLKEQGNQQHNQWDWVIVDNDAQDDMMALLKQIRLHYQGKLAVFGYQVAADQALLNRYHANALYEPLDKRQLYTMLDTRKKDTPTRAQTPRWQGITVLAVDDHLPNLLVLDALLSELGIHVITANSGFDAIEHISKQQVKGRVNTEDKHSSLSNKTQAAKAQTRASVNKHSTMDFDIESERLKTQPIENKSPIIEDKNHIDLIFMDIQMPRMSGREAAKQIRDIEAADSRIPIIALSAHGLADERHKMIKCGIDDYLSKPISQPQLLQVLQKWLGRATSFEAENTASSDVSKHIIPTPLATAKNKPISVSNASNGSGAPADQLLLTQSRPDDAIKDNAQYNQQGTEKIPRVLSLQKIRDRHAYNSYINNSHFYKNDVHNRYDYVLPRSEAQSRYSKLQKPPQPSYLNTDANEHNEHNNPVIDTLLDDASVMDSTTTLATLDIFNWEDALTRAAHKPDLAAKLISMMLDSVSQEKEALTQAWQAHDRNELAQIAHRILGASRYTGVPQLRQASQNLEDRCLLNVKHTTPAQLAMLKPHYEGIMMALNNLQNLDLSAYSELNYHLLNENDMNWKMI